MQGPEAVVRRLYEALAARDGEAMAACYAPEAEFHDPAFGRLRGADVGTMWRMLCARAKDLEVSVERAAADGPSADSEVVCRYTFSGTGRRVENRIRGTFVVKEGRIVLHHDTFDLHRWAGQALGWKGRLFGGMGWFQRKLQRQARANLRRFQEAESWAHLSAA